MSHPSITYINFAYCELEGKWEQINEDIHSDLDIYEAIEDGVSINIRLFSQEKTRYFMKKGSRITIRDYDLKFNKADFTK